MEGKEKPGYIQNLVNYIKKNLGKGYTPDALKFALMSQGYPRMEIEKAMKIVNEEMAMTLPKVPEKPVIKVETEPPQPEKKSFFGKVKSWFS